MMKTMDELSKIYYVYKCFVDDELKYIGMGKGLRYKHCGSGASHVPELNADLNSGKNILTTMYKTNLTRIDAMFIESDLIHKNFDTLYNKTDSVEFTNRPNVRLVKSAKIVASDKDYEVKRKVAELSEGATEKDYQNLRQCLSSLGIHIYLVDIGKVKNLLVLDKSEVDSHKIKHLACANYPHCAEMGCGG